MFDKIKLKRGLNKKQKATKDDYISSVVYANFGEHVHNMEVEDEKVFVEVYQRTQAELEPLIKADLYDFMKKEENGRTSKKRRNLLRRS